MIKRYNQIVGIRTLTKFKNIFVVFPHCISSCLIKKLKGRGDCLSLESNIASSLPWHLYLLFFPLQTLRKQDPFDAFEHLPLIGGST